MAGLLHEVPPPEEELPRQVVHLRAPEQSQVVDLRAPGQSQAVHSQVPEQSQAVV